MDYHYGIKWRIILYPHQISLKRSWLWCSPLDPTKSYKTKVFLHKGDVSLFTLIHLYLLRRSFMYTKFIVIKYAKIYFEILAHRPSTFTILSAMFEIKLFWLNLSKRMALKVMFNWSIIETYNKLAHYCFPCWFDRNFEIKVE